MSRTTQTLYTWKRNFNNPYDLPDTQFETMKVLWNLAFELGRPPKIDEIAKEMNKAKGTVYFSLKKLRDKRYIHLLPNGELTISFSISQTNS